MVDAELPAGSTSTEVGSTSTVKADGSTAAVKADGSTSAAKAEVPATSNGSKTASNERGSTSKAEGSMSAASPPTKSTTKTTKSKATDPSPTKSKSAALASALRPDSPPKIAEPPEAPRFWFGFEVSWAKILAGRIIFFGLLAADAVLAIRHAPRYGAGGFNVAQLVGDSLGPTRPSYAICQLGLAILFVFAACGIATRVVVPVCAVVYGWLYFGSQLDSYQHHYLVEMLLVISCAIPWQRPVDARPDTPIRTWGLRLFLVQLAILYLWAAISKCTPKWTDGTALGMQVVTVPDHFNFRGLIDRTIGIAAMAKLVLATEFGLAATIWWRPTWRFVAPIGILFHVGIVLTKFDIGLFAWLMIGIYAFVIPDRIWIAIGNSLGGVARIGRSVRARCVGRTGWIIAGAFAFTALMLAMISRFHYATMIATILAGVSVGASLSATRLGPTSQARAATTAAAFLVAMLVWTVVDRASDVATDYYRFWGGSSRRLGDSEAAINAYRMLTKVDPDEPAGHYQLGQLIIEKEPEAGLAELHEAQRLEPSRARAFMAEAGYLVKIGKKPEAIAKAREATFAEPSNSDARALLAKLSQP